MGLGDQGHQTKIIGSTEDGVRFPVLFPCIRADERPKVVVFHFFFIPGSSCQLSLNAYYQ